MLSREGPGHLFLPKLLSNPDEKPIKEKNISGGTSFAASLTNQPANQATFCEVYIAIRTNIRDLIFHSLLTYCTINHPTMKSTIQPSILAGHHPLCGIHYTYYPYQKHQYPGGPYSPSLREENISEYWMVTPLQCEGCGTG